MMSAELGSHGTPANQNIFTNYLKAVYVNDGSFATSEVNAMDGDSIFGGVPMSPIATNLGANRFPDEIDAGVGADVIFNYNSPSNHAAIKFEGNVYRSIFFAIGMEMPENTETRNQIIALSRAWLTDQMVGTKYHSAINSLLDGENYPNPAKDYTCIKVTEIARNGSIEIYNLKGNLMARHNIGNALAVRIDVGHLPAGVYTYRVISGNNISEVRKLIVIR